MFCCIAARRARSASRKRGPDDPDAVDRTGSFYQAFRSPSSGPGGSNHSSPASANLPSPAMSNLENLNDSSPNLSHPSAHAYTPPLSAPAFHSSPSKFEQNDYALQASPLSQTNPHPILSANEHHSQGFYPMGSADTSLFNAYGFNSSLDPGFSGFDGTPTGLSMAVPSSSFAGTGLPFTGLEFIKNYPTNGYSTSDQESLWQSYDPGAFGYDPDMPFTLGDPSSLDASMHTEPSSSSQP
jgi:hypothetical protein